MGLSKALQLLEGLVDDPQLLFIARMGNIDDVQQNIGLADFIQRTFEAFHEVVGQLADKSDGVAEQERCILKDYFAGSRIEGGKELILGEDVALAQEIHERGFADVSVADQCDADKFSAVLTLGECLFVDLLQTAAQQGDLIAGDPAVSLDFRLTRTPGPDTAPQPFEVIPHPAKPWQNILILSQFYLKLGLRRLGPTGKDIEDQVGPVNGLGVEDLFNSSRSGNLLARHQR